MVEQITLEQIQNELSRILDKYEWFVDAVIEGRNICVYVNSMDSDVAEMIPDVMYGTQIKLGFASYLTCADKYGLQSF
jgi:hypothetical protein